MLKAILMSLWLMGLLAGSVYFFGTRPPAMPETAESEKPKIKLEYVKLEPITSVIIRDNAITGYVIVELSFALDKKKKDEYALPVELLLRDRIVGALHSDKSIDVSRLDDFDIKDFSQNLRVDINKSFDEELVREILIQNINFVTKREVRDSQLR